MEPDLDRLFDFEVHGGLFPQFRKEWESVYQEAQRIVEQVREDCGGRCRVALLATHPLSFAALFLAFAREEVDLFLFNPTWGRSEMDTARRIAASHFEVSDSEPGVFRLQRSASVASGERVDSGANRLRVMIATGGSSGRIRFAIHNWSTLAAASYGFEEFLACERMAAHCVLPLYHVSGFMQMIRALLTMGSVVFGRVETFAEGHALLSKEKRSNRFLSLVATQLERLLADEANVDRLRDYRAIFLGGGPVSVGLLERARGLSLPLAPTYGMTETAAQVATLIPESFLAGELCQGKALPHVRLEIVDEVSHSLVLDPGNVGLIKIYGTSLFHGYYGEAGAGPNYSVITSDLGFLDERDRLTVMGRADRVLISGGEKVNLREVEMALEKSGLVRDVVCFGREDREWGEALHAAYVPQDIAVSEAVLKDVIGRQLSNYKMPKKWIRLEQIPRNEAGKPLIAEIGEKAGA